jgi:hypothetical protein
MNCIAGNRKYEKGERYKEKRIKYNLRCWKGKCEIIL